jgi:hypothetical protein
MLDPAAPTKMPCILCPACLLACLPACLPAYIEKNSQCLTQSGEERKRVASRDSISCGRHVRFVLPTFHLTSESSSVAHWISAVTQGLDAFSFMQGIDRHALGSRSRFFRLLVAAGRLSEPFYSTIISLITLRALHRHLSVSSSSQAGKEVVYLATAYTVDTRGPPSSFSYNSREPLHSSRPSST